MCGISGILFNNHNGIDYELQIRKMTTEILHRGPNGSDVYISNNFAFGHTRLSIIDLSDDASQPMIFENRYVIEKLIMNLGYKM